MEYFDKILHTYTFQHYLSTAILPYIRVFFDGRGFAEHQLKIWDQVVKMRITLEPYMVYSLQILYTYVL